MMFSSISDKTTKPMFIAGHIITHYAEGLMKATRRLKKTAKEVQLRTRIYITEEKLLHYCPKFVIVLTT